MSDQHTFLSTEWFTAVAMIVEQHGDAGGAHAETKVNLVITGTPFDSDIEFHMGNAEGRALMGAGHIDGADVTLTTDYVTAAEVFVSGNPQAGMQAFMAGKVKVQGDMAKLMASQGGGGNPEMQSAIEAITNVPS